VLPLRGASNACHEGERAAARTSSSWRSCREGRRCAAGARSPRAVDNPSLIILHAATADGRLLVWGETSEPPKKTRKVRWPRAEPAPLGAERLPLDAGEDQLRHALASAAVVTRTGLARPFTAWLPTKNGAALPSSVLVSDDADPDPRAPAKPWTVTAIPLPPGHAIALLRAAAGKPLITPGVTGGDDLRFFCAVLRFAAGLVGAGQFVPGIARDRAAFHARWVPFLQGETARAFTRLAQAAPRAALALADGPREGATGGPAENVAVAAFVEAMVDALVRQAAEPAPATETASAHEHWVAALRSPDDTLLGTDASLEALATHVRNWQRPVVGTAAAPFRLTVRLEEPPEEAAADPPPDERPWHLRFLLQSNADPSLLIPAEQAWQRGALLKRLLPEAGFGVREHLLLSLGRAAAAFPRIVASLRAAAPAGLDLDTRGAHEFLTQGAGALEQAGFGVLLPSWWTRGGPGVRLTVSGVARPPRMKASSGLSLDALTQFDLQVSLGGAQLTRDELLALAAAKEPLVRFRGRWVHVTAEEIRAALAVWKRKGGPLTARQVIGLALGAPAEQGPLPLAGVETSGWLDDLLKQLTGQAPMDSRARCVRTRRAACRGCTSSAAGASAPAWRTTWASARPCRRWRSCSTCARPATADPCCSSARRP
jgi:hypothetical protein